MHDIIITSYRIFSLPEKSCASPIQPFPPPQPLTSANLSLLHTFAFPEHIVEIIWFIIGFFHLVIFILGSSISCHSL